MDQEKIGKFIMNLRKEKNLTQRELALKLGVTDRAISKWENGRGMPDLSLLQPLCDILGITVNELFNGEIITEKRIENYEKTVINTIDYSKNIVNKTKKLMHLLGIGLALLIIILIALFGIDFYKMANGEKVLFSTWGFKYHPPIDLSTELIENAIIDYLVTDSENSSSNYKNAKWFAALNTYLIEEDNNTYTVSAWVLEESYYLENGEVLTDSGSSMAKKFTVVKTNDNYMVTKVECPKDGSYYVPSMKKLFPKDVRKRMSNVYEDGTVERLKLEIDNLVKLYFHIN